MKSMPLTRIENAGYWICFIGAFLAIAAWESYREKRKLLAAAERRWKNHGAMFVIGALISAALLRFTPVVLALLVAGSPYGVLNRGWPPFWLRCVIAVLALDLVQYAMHWTNHHVPWLWRVHQVHHSDLDFDVSTSVRFHPIEMLLAQGAQLAAIAVLAPPALGVLIHELLAVVVNFAQHANASPPAPVERLFRFFAATPDVHRLHHSIEIGEQQRNYGEIFLWWDRLFQTYMEKPAADARAFRTGLAEFEKADTLNVGFMLTVPFRGTPTGAPSAEPKAAPDTAA
jgi:sterol desaturase/sphingolipid hydroxylase (fatty acid hydroxylase superfamily)